MPDVDTPSVASRVVAAASPHGVPVLFGDAPHRCTGWLHGAPGDVGVVLCAPLGADEESTHRGLLHLAHALASRGIAVLRFDYPGTGDSEGDCLSGTTPAMWVDAVVRAAGLLRVRAGCRDIGLAGFRLGAALASMAAARAQARWLALWAPVSNGRLYARELRAVAALGASERRVDACIEIAGHVYAPEFIDALAGMGARDGDLDRVQRVLLLQRDDVAPDLKLHAYLHDTSAELDVQSFTGYSPMMDRPHEAKLPRGAIDALTDWFTQRAADASSSPAAATPDVGGVGTQTDWLDTATWREQILRLGQARSLACVLCVPRNAEQNVPLLVLLNAGAVRHTGPGRLYVRLARELAARGVASLRVDLSMLGDSIVPDAPDENDCYARSTLDDVFAVIGDVSEHLGLRRPVLAGLCSGAYWALQAAFDPRAQGLLHGVAMINPLIISGLPQAGFESGPGPDASEALRYRRALRSWASWKKLLTLRADTLAAFGVLLRRGASIARAVLRNLGQQWGLLGPHAVALGLQRMRERKVVLGLFVGGTEPGYLLLRQEAPREVAAGLADSSIRMFTLPGSDHTFSGEAAKRELFRVFGDFLLGLRVR